MLAWGILSVSLYANDPESVEHVIITRSRRCSRDVLKALIALPSSSITQPAAFSLNQKQEMAMGLLGIMNIIVFTVFRSCNNTSSVLNE